MNREALLAHVSETWEKSIVPELEAYIRIPCKSPAYDPDWEKAGHLDAAVTRIKAFCDAQKVEGYKSEIVKLPGRTPVLFMEIPGTMDDVVLMYGHYDKQPEMTGWDEGKGPWIPVREGDKLYGRGGADDGYAAFASLLSIIALRKQGLSHPRVVVLIEGCEESGSFDLPFYVQALKARIGKPSLVVCLDSGCGNYEQLWMTTSLRGLVGGTLSIDVLTQGVHSGDASGIVPSSFRILRQLLDRIEDSATGRILGDAFYAPIPDERIAQAKKSGDVLGDDVFSRFPYAGSTHAMGTDRTELILNRTWRPTLSVTGIDGLPPIGSAGNVLRPKTAVKLSIRIPPGARGSEAAAYLKTTLEKDPPYGAKVRFEAEEPADGWNAPATAPWLERACGAASEAFFGKAACHMGEGGTIPFMGMLGKEFPEAQFMITGVLGPASNAHGPNEFLHIDMGKKLTACVAHVVHAQANR